MPEDGYNSVSIPVWCPGTSQLLHLNQGGWAECGTVITEKGFYAEPGKVPAGSHWRIYTSGSCVQQTGYNFVTTQGQGCNNKNSGSQSDLIPFMQRCDEAAGLDKLCQSGTTTGKSTIPPLTVFTQENLQTPLSSLSKELRPIAEAIQVLHW